MSIGCVSKSGWRRGVSMSDFEAWWEANWKMICGTSYFFSSEKTVAQIAWNVSKEKAEAQVKELEGELAEAQETLEALNDKPLWDELGNAFLVTCRRDLREARAELAEAREDEKMEFWSKQEAEAEVIELKDKLVEAKKKITSLESQLEAMVRHVD